MRRFLLILMSRVAQNHLVVFFARLSSTSNCSDLSCELCCRHLLVHYVFSSCIRAALFILREVRFAGAKSRNLTRNRREQENCGRQKRLCMQEGVWTVKCRRGSGEWSCMRACEFCVCVSQSVSRAAAASPWLFSLQMSCAGMWVFLLGFLVLFLCI